MRTLTRKQKTLAALATAGIVLGGSGTAYAYWTTTGSGTGSGATATAAADPLRFSQNTLTAMYPGDGSQDLTVTVTNTSTTQKVYVAAVTAYITTDKDGCSASDYLLGGTTAPGDADHARGLTWTGTELVADGGHQNATSTIQFNDTTENQDACKGATVTLHYSAS